jgi:hypothetical protein
MEMVETGVATPAQRSLFPTPREGKVANIWYSFVFPVERGALKE